MKCSSSSVLLLLLPVLFHLEEHLEKPFLYHLLLVLSFLPQPGLLVLHPWVQLPHTDSLLVEDCGMGGKGLQVTEKGRGLKNMTSYYLVHVPSLLDVVLTPLPPIHTLDNVLIQTDNSS